MTAAGMIGLALSLGAGVVYWFFYHVPSHRLYGTSHTIQEDSDGGTTKTSSSRGCDKEAGKDVLETKKCGDSRCCPKPAAKAGIVKTSDSQGSGDKVGIRPSKTKKCKNSGCRPRPVVKEGSEKGGQYTKARAMTHKLGTITNVSVPNGRYYVVIGSFIDDDLARDYASQLTRKGVSATLIAPPKGQHFYRVAVDWGRTLPEARTKVADLPSGYRAGAWIVKY